MESYIRASGRAARKWETSQARFAADTKLIGCLFSFNLAADMISSNCLEEALWSKSISAR